MPEGSFQIGVHLHVPELGDDEVQVGDRLRLFLGVMLQKQLCQLQTAESQFRSELHLRADLNGFLVVSAGFIISFQQGRSPAQMAEVT